MKYKCPACKSTVNLDGRLGKVIKSFCEIKGKSVNLRRAVKKSTTQTKVWACKSNPTPRLPSS